jgi:hypothetical protein
MLTAMLAAMLGAFLGLNSRSPVSAALVGAALIGAAHLTVDTLSVWVLWHAPRPALLLGALEALGLGRGGLARAMCAGGATAMASAALVRLAAPPRVGDPLNLPGEPNFRRRRKHATRRQQPARAELTEALHRVDGVLNGSPHERGCNTM